MYDYHDKFSLIVPEDTVLERIATGFQFTEGPVWNTTENFLLFSNIPANRIYRWSSDLGVTVFREPSGNSNGLTYDKDHRLILCEHGNRRVSRIEKDGVCTVLAKKFGNKRLNSPNDIVVKSDGTIYFTDPTYGIKPQEQELLFQGVYRLNPVTEALTLLVRDFDSPNGLAFSPDERRLYVADSAKRHIRVFDVNPDGTMSAGCVFAEIRSEIPGNPDGMKVDVDGNLYVAAAGGVWIFSDEGENVGIVTTPERPSNLAWADEDLKSLVITARTSVFRVRLNIPGLTVS